ncbi:MAG: GNAT family N-acetyltransferase [Chloroflexota bacterium]
MHIRTMQAADLDFAARCTLGEGWVSETRQEFESFFAYDPSGCFIAEQDGQPLGIAVATCYGRYAFIGELIVSVAWRGRGLGSQLFAHAVAYLQQHGAENILLDGVLAAVPIYERAGFRGVCLSLRFSGSLPGAAHPHVRPMHASDLAAVCALDRQAFAADRSFFLQRRLEHNPGLCLVYEQGGVVAGFVQGRRSDSPSGPGVTAGPWVVSERVENPLDLLEGLQACAPGALLRLGVLETNIQAVALLERSGFTARADSPLHMLLGSDAALGQSPQCCAIGSSAKG